MVVLSTQLCLCDLHKLQVKSNFLSILICIPTNLNIIKKAVYSITYQNNLSVSATDLIKSLKDMASLVA